MSGTQRMICLRTGGKVWIRTRTSSRTLTEQFLRVRTYIPTCTPSIAMCCCCDRFSSLLLSVSPHSHSHSHFSFLDPVRFVVHKFIIFLLSRLLSTSVWPNINGRMNHESESDESNHGRHLTGLSDRRSSVERILVGRLQPEPEQHPEQHRVA